MAFVLRGVETKGLRTSVVRARARACPSANALAERCMSHAYRFVKRVGGVMFKFYFKISRIKKINVPFLFFILVVPAPPLEPLGGQAVGLRLQSPQWTSTQVHRRKAHYPPAPKEEDFNPSLQGNSGLTSGPQGGRL